MAQADQSVANATFPTVRTDINNNLAALFSQNSGNSAPAVTVAFMPWIDTSSSPAVWKVRNAANSGWITIGTLDASTFSSGGMTAIANGGTGETTASAAINALLPAQSGNSGKALITNGTLAAWGAASGLVRAVAVSSTSGSNIDFSIPSGVKRVTVIFAGVSTNGTSDYLIQLGGSGSVNMQTTGYLGSSTVLSNAIDSYNYTTGFGHAQSNAANITHGSFVITNITGDQWVCSGVCGRSNNAVTVLTAGSVTLSNGTLDKLRITTVGGTNTFDAGTINVMTES